MTATQESPTDSVTEQVRQAPRPSRLARVARIIGLFMLLVVVAGLIVSGIYYWQERPLAEAERAWKQGDYVKAQRLAEYFLENHPAHSRATLIRARALTRLGDAAEATRQFETVGVASVEDTHMWAEALLAGGRFTEALPLLLRVVHLQPENADALYEITTCRMRLQMHREALKTAEQFAQLPDCEARGRLLMATIEYDLKNYKQAAAECEVVLKLEPDGEHLQVPPHEFFVFFGRTLLNAGRPREVLPIVARSVLWKPTAEAYVLLGEAAKQIGESQRAVSFWQSALKLDPEYVPAREGLASQSLVDGDARAALKTLEPLEKDSRLTASVAYLFQRAYVMVDEPELAATWQQRADELRKRERLMNTVNRVLFETPDSFWAAMIRAHRFAEAGNWRQADEILSSCPPDARQQPFVEELIAAVKARGELPPLERLPLKQF